MHAITKQLLLASIAWELALLWLAHGSGYPAGRRQREELGPCLGSQAGQPAECPLVNRSNSHHACTAQWEACRCSWPNRELAIWIIYMEQFNYSLDRYLIDWWRPFRLLAVVWRSTDGRIHTLREYSTVHTNIHAVHPTDEHYAPTVSVCFFLFLLPHEDRALTKLTQIHGAGRDDRSIPARRQPYSALVLLKKITHIHYLFNFIIHFFL